MQRSRLLYSCLLAFAVPCVTVARSQAYWVHTCNGIDSRWAAASINYQIMRCSIPSQSAAYIDATYAFNAWNNVRGMSPMFAQQDGTTQCVSIDHNDGVNQIFMTSAIGDSLGMTWFIYSSSCFWWFDAQWIQEADIALNANYPFAWGAPLCDQYDPAHYGSRTTLVHEMGHALGLLHDDRFMNMMMTNDGEGKYCGSAATVFPHPDAEQGGRRLYPGLQRDGHDLGASEFRLAGSNDVELNNTAGTTSVCPGDTFTFRWSVGNLGTFDEVYDVDWYLSTDRTITTSDIFVTRNVGASELKENFNTWTKTITIPNTVAWGTVYYLGTILDPDNHIGEWYETNNGTYAARKFLIKFKNQCP